jgi:ABC-type Fe3+-hydroxamate transport system substrate-binding protein
LFVLTGCEQTDVIGITDDSSTSDTPDIFGTSETDDLEPKYIAAVVLSPFLAEITAELGYGASVIGRGTYVTYPPIVADLPEYGSAVAPNISAIIGSGANTLITSVEPSSQDRIALGKAGITLQFIPYPRAVSDFENAYITTATVFDHHDIAKANAERIFKPIKDILANTGATNIGSFIYIAENGKCAGADTFEHAVLSSFGDNIFEDKKGYDTDPAFDGGLSTVIMALPEAERDELKKSIPDNVRVIVADPTLFISPSERLAEFLKRL